MADRRSAFAPVVAAGLAGAALAAVAGTRPWLEPWLPDSAAVSRAVLARPEVTNLLVAPLAGALALLVLACWGVLLVTRGWFRRVVAWLSVLAAVGYAVTAVTAPWRMQDPVAQRLRDLSGSDVAGTEMTAWWWAALVAAALVVATTTLAALLVPRWPEMGTRYDAPTGAPAEARSTGQESNIDLWKALDEGRDPTT